MESGKLFSFAISAGDCRCSGRQTIGNGSPFNPDLLTPARRLFKSAAGRSVSKL